MTLSSRSAPEPPGHAPFVDLTPKLFTQLREGYGLSALRADALAGLTVAIVALPLSMAIAIASGVGPERGLYAAIVGGFLVSALGGSRYQIGGPAGAFIVLVAAAVQMHGVEGMLLATLMSGVMLAALGLLRVGAYIKYIPYPVTVGFTAGIGAIIAASQLAPFFGLRLAGPEPGPFLEKLPALWAAVDTINPVAALVAATVAALIFGLRAWRPALPGMLIAVALAGVATAWLELPVETIAQRFGALPSALPAPALPPLDPGLMLQVLPTAIAFTLLGAIESLLSAVVADGMTGRRHRSNIELIAQGIANIAAALFGAMCVTGTIARTATNVRAGARGPVAGMLHAVFLLGFMMLAAPLAGWIPLAALAGVLMTVAWGMAERHAFAALLKSGRGEAVVLLATFGLTLLRDLTEAIIVGVALSALLFIRRMAESTTVAPDSAEDGRAPYDPEDRAVAVLRVNGALFFGAAATMDAALDRIGDPRKLVVVDVSAAPVMDSTGARSLAQIADRARRQGSRFAVAGASVAAKRALAAQDIAPPQAIFAADAASAVALWRAESGEDRR
jgi:SulP family sulfate permease